MPTIHISLTAERLFPLTPSLWVTNSLLTTWVVMVVLILAAIVVTRRLCLVPGHLQSVAEILIDGLSGLFGTILGERSAYFFPLVATIFLYILTLNWLGLLPGVGTIGLTRLGPSGQGEFVPLFRSGTADLNTTLALALVAMSVIQLSGLRTLGRAYLKKFLNFRSPIYFFVGILELVSELSKVISFAFRLFGNIFAGEVLLTVIAFLMPIIAPIPFLGLEVFVGFIQALVFSMLTSVFLSLATSSAEHA